MRAVAGATSHDHAPPDDVAAMTARQVSAARRRVWTGVASAVLGVALTMALAQHGITLPAWAWLGGAAALALVGLAGWTRPLLALAIALLFGGLTTARALTTPPDSLPVLLASVDVDEPVVAVEGVLLRSPRPARIESDPFASRGLQRPRHVAWLQVRRAEVDGTWRDASGRLLIVTDGPEPFDARAGDVVRALGVYERPRPALNPGEPARLVRAVHDGDAGVLACSSPSLVTRSVDASFGIWERTRARLIDLRERARERAQAILDQATAGATQERRELVRALMLGVPSSSESRDLTDVFTRLGLLHVLSISGFHLTVVALVALFALRLTGDRGGLEPLLVALAVGSYTLLVPLEAPIARSALMVFALLVVEATGRRYDRVCVLGLVTLLLLVMRPLDVFSLGFQLSVGLTAMLLWAGQPMRWALLGEPLRGLIEDKPTAISRLAASGGDALAAALLCWLVSLPLLAHATGLVSPVGVLATLVVGPIIVAALWAGCIALASGAVWSALAVPAGLVLQGASSLASTLARAIDAIPFSSVRVPDPGSTWALFATIALCVWARFAYRLRPLRRVGVLAIIGLTYPLAVWLHQRPDPRVALRIDAFAVGDGTSMLLRSGSDALLWDCKALPRAGPLPGITAASRALASPRVARLVVTHPDVDHFSGIVAAAQTLGVREALLPARFLEQAEAEPGFAAGAALAELRAQGVSVRPIAAGDVFMLGSSRVSVLSPRENADFALDNDHSLVALIETPTLAGVRRVLLTGDAGPAALAQLPDLTPLAPFAMLELPHHGAYNDQAASLVESTTPAVVVQSAGTRRLAERRWDSHLVASTRLITARDGAVLVEIRTNGSILAGPSRRGMR